MTPQEALEHAIAADLARLLPQDRAFVRSTPAEMAADHMAGRENPHFQFLRGMAELGHPDHFHPSRQPLPPDLRADAEAMLGNYPGLAWLPHQVEDFKGKNGREPDSLDMSPGGQMVDQINERQKLYRDIESARNGGIAGPPRHGWFFSTSPGAWVGQANLKPEVEMNGAATNYAESLGRERAAAFSDASFLQRPDNWVGNLATKVLGVGPDIGSQAATARNTGGSALDAVGNAATRWAGADWNRMHPHLSQSQGTGLQNDHLIHRMRSAWDQSQGQTSGDTFRSWFGDYLPENGRIPGIQPGINAAMSFANGLLDGSTLATGGISGLVKAGATQVAKSGVPLAGKYAASVADDIARAGRLARTGRELVDESLDPTQLAASAVEFIEPALNENREAFQARTAAEAANRQQQLRLLDANKDKLATPKTTFQSVTEPVTKRAGSFLGNLFY
jgi:hypothetical protein